VIALTGARLLDGTGQAPRTGVTVIIENGRITAVGETPPPPGAEISDLGGRTLMPGLIDVHVHLSSLDRSLDPGLRPFGMVQAARAMLDGGITTVRDLGSYGGSLFDLRGAIEQGLVAGPRLVLCGQIVAATSPGAQRFPGMYREADGPDELRKAVREQIRQGAELVKVMSTGALTVPGEDVDPAQLTPDELGAVVDEAHRLGLPVASHAEGSAGIRLSVDAGVDTIEHGEMGYEVPDALAAMAERGIVLVPTLAVFDAVADPGGPFPPWMRERALRLREAAYRTVAAAIAAGVTMAMGADAGPHGANARELVLMVEAGLSAKDGIAAATAAAARVCGLEEEIGTVEVGKRADLLVVDGDPLDDVRVLTDPRRIWLVLRDGVPVAGSSAGEHARNQA
jgi:imidazolonepropionase-like amidohydrolase